jgi:Repeat of unknown function (DUF5650)
MRSMMQALALLLLATVCTRTHANETAITGPTGSGIFGADVKVLPNGNIVVTDPDGPTANIGTVYLYTPAGIKISSFTGSSPNDHVGSGGIAVLANGNFVVVSPHWTNGAVANAGAVTWVNGTSGLSGVVSTSNSLVGSSANDQVGYFIDAAAPPYDSIADYSIRVLANGNFLVTSLFWNNAAATQAGAVTLINGATGIAGAVSAANSLVGTHANDQVGSYYCFLLDNGNIVVVSPTWSSALANQVGAVTWMSGTQGLAGAVSPSNSLVGLSANDQVGSAGVSILTNNNYVIQSPTWNNGAAASAGAATWADGNAATSGVVSPANSLVGSTSNDQVGVYGTVALANGNYVVHSPFWNNGAATSAGAATWGNGSVGTTGTVTAANSLVGSTSNDAVGSIGVFALSNGNYVVGSPQWNNDAATAAGAVTWGNGTTGISGVVSPQNSLVGTNANDQVGDYGAYALSNGNYVVPSLFWSNGAVGAVGAVTWANGSVGISGPVTASNSLVGTTALDLVGIGGVYALSNGNYVVDSYGWINAGAARAGAITWADGTVGIVGAVSSANSLVGVQANDRVGLGFITPLSNGNYVVSSPNWANGAATQAGALTWASGTAAITGPVSAANSLVGTSTGDAIGSVASALSNGSFVTSSPFWNNTFTGATQAGAVTWSSGSTAITGTVSSANSFVGTNNNDRIASGILIGQTRVRGVRELGDSNYLVFSQHWNNGAATAAGAITLASGRFPLSGNVQAYNSVRGTLANEGATMPEDYDTTRKQLVVGRPLENIVSVFTMDQIFAEGFD